MGALKAQNRGAPPVYTSSRHKPTSNMADRNFPGRKDKLKEIVLFPYPAESDRKDVNISQGKIIQKVHSNESGCFYQVLLPVKTVDPLGQNVVFPDGKVQIKFWVSETMLAKANEIPESKLYPECVRAMRVHECESYPDCIPSKGICKGGKYV